MKPRLWFCSTPHQKYWFRYKYINALRLSLQTWSLQLIVIWMIYQIALFAQNSSERVVNSSISVRSNKKKLERTFPIDKVSKTRFSLAFTNAASPKIASLVTRATFWCGNSQHHIFTWNIKHFNRTRSCTVVKLLGKLVRSACKASSPSTCVVCKQMVTTTSHNLDKKMET